LARHYNKKVKDYTGYDMRNLDQTFRIKRLLAERGESISSMARKLDRPFGSVANTVYGYRTNSDLQAAIASFLELAPEELFRGPGAGGDACEPDQPCSTMAASSNP
jgi:hypothetical protein